MMNNHRNHRAILNLLKLLVMLLVLIGLVAEAGPALSMHEIEILVPIDPGRLPEGLTLVGTPLKELEVRVRGSQSALKALSQKVPRYNLDLSSVAVGTEFVPVDPDSIQMPEGVSIMRVNPAYLTVKVDRWLKKKVPVRVSVTGNPTGSFFVDSAIARPSSMAICGPETVVAAIDEILTKPIDATGRSEPFKKEIAPDLAEGVEICSAPAIILAEIYFAEKLIVRRFADILVEGQNTQFNYNITPRTLTLEIKGPQNVISNLQPQNDIRVSVELKNLKPGVYVRRAVISLPVKTTLVNVEPELFTVKVSGEKP